MSAVVIYAALAIQFSMHKISVIPLNGGGYPYGAGSGPREVDASMKR